MAIHLPDQTILLTNFFCIFTIFMLWFRKNQQTNSKIFWIIRSFRYDIHRKTKKFGKNSRWSNLQLFPCLKSSLTILWFNRLNTIFLGWLIHVHSSIYCLLPVYFRYSINYFWLVSSPTLRIEMAFMVYHLRVNGIDWYLKSMCSLYL